MGVNFDIFKGFKSNFFQNIIVNIKSIILIRFLDGIDVMLKTMGNSTWSLSWRNCPKFCNWFLLVVFLNMGL